MPKLIPPIAGISARDVGQTIMQLRDIEVPDGKTIIDIVPNEFILKDGTKTTDPVGSLSPEFTLNAQIILADKDYTRLLIMSLSLSINDFKASPYCLFNLSASSSEISKTTHIVPHIL